MKWKKNVHYVVVPELPEEQQQPFWNWLNGQTCPVIEEEGENKMKCAYKDDYDRWLSSWLKGQEAAVTD